MNNEILDHFEDNIDFVYFLINNATFNSSGNTGACAAIQSINVGCCGRAGARVRKGIQ